MNDEEAAYITELEGKIQQADQKTGQVQQGMTAMFNSEHHVNLVKWQLDIEEELERIEHLLKGHVPKIDKAGNQFFEEAKDGDRLFNDKGVAEILKILSWYLNKNIILSNFDEDQISLRVHQFSRTFTDFLFFNYEKFGLDTEEKRKHYPMIVLTIVDTVEAAYLRALRGGERDSLRTARTVHQTENPMMGQFAFNPGQIQNKKKFSMMNPKTWG